MNYAIRFKRLEHVGGTKEYRVFFFRDVKTGIAHTVKMWGKVGRLTGHSTERDDTGAKFEKTVREKEGRGYRLDGSMSQDREVAKADHWIEHERGEAARFGLPEAFALYQQMLARGGHPLTKLDDETVARTEHFKAGGTAKTFGKPKPAEPDYSANPDYGIF